MGGWIHHAAKLSDYLLGQGEVPCTRKAHGRVIEFRLGTDGDLEAWLLLDDGKARKVADEEGVKLYLKDAPKAAPTASGAIRVRADGRLHKRLLRAVKATGRSQSEIIREGLRLWLQTRGF
jgi:hypothetical protein